MVKKIILWIITIFWAIMIFMFSSEPSDMSNKTSIGFTQTVITFLVKADIIDIPVSSLGAEEFIHNIAEKINHYIRKLAHFSAYLVLGVLVYNLLLCYFTNKKSLILSLIICLLYAISDEIHQMFVPGRAGQIRDVLIDFSGILTGTLILYLFSRIKMKSKKDIVEK